LLKINSNIYEGGSMSDMQETTMVMIKAIIQIIKDSKNKDEALKKIEALLK
jgi:hypothetical protein